MKITKLETFLVNGGLRNYLFVRLTTDTGLTGLGEATLEWQEATVQTLLHEWVEDRVLGVDPFDIEKVFGDLIRDQYQGGSTVLTAISGHVGQRSTERRDRPFHRVPAGGRTVGRPG